MAKAVRGLILALAISMVFTLAVVPGYAFSRTDILACWSNGCGSGT